VPAASEAARPSRTGGTTAIVYHVDNHEKHYARKGSLCPEENRKNHNLAGGIEGPDGAATLLGSTLSVLACARWAGTGEGVGERKSA
jgi:hypothetical protein